jgi:TM2 domain-containing membrane protein YozV
MTQPPWPGPDDTTPEEPRQPDQPQQPEQQQPQQQPPPEYQQQPPPGYGQQPPPGYGQQPPPGWQPPPQGYQQPPGPAGYGQQYPGYGPGYGLAPYADPQAKSKIVAGLLGVFLGGFGVHRFYLGYTKIGVIQIVVTVLTCGIGALWGFIEGILYLVGAGGYTTDATGRPLRE